MKAALISAWHATQAAVDAAWQDIEAEETRANVDAFRVALKQARIAAWRLADYLEKTVPRTPKQARDLVPAPAAPPSAPAFPIVIVDEAPGIPPPASYEGYAVPSSGGRSYVMTHEATLDDCVRALCVARERSPDGVVLLQRHTDAKLGAGRPQIWWFAYGSLADLTNDLDNPGDAHELRAHRHEHAARAAEGTLIMAPKKAPKTPNPKTDKTPSVAQLRKKLHDLTGFMPKSDSPRYLSERLEQVLARQAAGENVRRFNGGGTAKVIGVSISVAGESAVKHALRDGETFSSFARVAFGRELRTRGLPNSADIVEAG